MHDKTELRELPVSLMDQSALEVITKALRILCTIIQGFLLSGGGHPTPGEEVTVSNVLLQSQSHNEHHSLLCLVICLLVPYLA